MFKGRASRSDDEVRLGPVIAIPRGGAIVNADKSALEAYRQATSSQRARKINVGHRASAASALFPRRLAGREHRTQANLA
jgi:hypothetical protein